MRRGRGSFLNGHDCLIRSIVFVSAASLYNAMVTSATVLGRCVYISSSFKKLKHLPSAQGMPHFLSASLDREQSSFTPKSVKKPNKLNNSQTKTTYKNNWNHYLFTAVPSSILEPINISNTGFLKLLRIQSTKPFSIFFS